jgi:hypothetical protein
MQAHHRLLLLNGRENPCMRDGFGCLGTIDSTEAGMFGCVATRSTRLGAGLCGFPAAGCLAAGDMSTSLDPGGNAYQTCRLDSARTRHKASSRLAQLNGF